MRASVHIDLPGWTREGIGALKRRCEELGLQPRSAQGEGGGQTGVTYDISNKHRLGHSEVQLVQTMINGVNRLYEEDLQLQKKHDLEAFKNILPTLYSKEAEGSVQVQFTVHKYAIFY